MAYRSNGGGDEHVRFVTVRIKSMGLLYSNLSLLVIMSTVCIGYYLLSFLIFDVRTVVR